MPKKLRATSLENIFVSEAHRQIYSEISYLKKRIHLVEGERKANFESNEESLKKNDLRIKELKEKNAQFKAQRKKMIDSKESFVKQIAERLGGEKKAYEFKDKKFSDVLDILECKIGTLRNKQNALVYNKTEQKKRMKTAALEEEDLRNIFEGKGSTESERLSSNVKRRLADIKATETATAAMFMKITEADNIRSRYKNMTSLVKSENFSLTIKVREHDRTIEYEKTEIERIRNVLKDSMKAKKMAKLRLVEIEEKTIQDYSEREQQLYESRMKLKLIREQMEQIGSKLSFPKFHMIHRDSSVTDGLYVGYQTNDDNREAKAESTIESVYNQLANMIGEADPALIVIRFQEQRDHSKELLAQEDVAKSSVRKAKLRKRFLVDKLSQLQFSGGVRREKLNSKFAILHDEMTTIESEREKLKQWLNDHCSAMDQMKSKLIEICQNIGLKIPSLTNEIGAENVNTLLKLVLKHLEKLLGARDRIFSPTMLSPATTGTEKDDTAATFGGLLPLEITAEGPIFNLPSPMGSTASYRIGGSFSHIEMLPGGAGAAGGIGGVDKMQFDFDAIRDRAPSITVNSVIDFDETASLLDTEPEDILIAKPATAIKIKTVARRRNSNSEDEDAMSRNIIKRQSQILYEAKTRKGRFNAGIQNNVRNRK